ncbi:MAG: hypothetical protein AB1716_05595 [Planctomycetota bacterium]
MTATETLHKMMQAVAKTTTEHAPEPGDTSPPTAAMIGLLREMIGLLREWFYTPDVCVHPLVAADLARIIEHFARERPAVVRGFADRLTADDPPPADPPPPTGPAGPHRRF